MEQDFTLPARLPRDFRFPITGKRVVPLRMTHQEILQRIIDSLLPEFEGMPSVPIYIANHEHFNKSKTVAFYQKKKIIVRPDYYKSTNFADMVDTLRHELIHAWDDWKGNGGASHGQTFREKALELGVKAPPSSPLLEYWDTLSSGYFWPLPIIGGAIGGLYAILRPSFSQASLEDVLWWVLAFFVAFPVVGVISYRQHNEKARKLDLALRDHLITYAALVIVGFGWYSSAGTFVSKTLVLLSFGLMLLLYLPACDPYQRGFSKKWQGVYHYTVLIFFVIGVAWFFWGA